MVKIAIIGTYSTGKTTLTRNLCQELGKAAVEIDENVRDITRNFLKKESTGHLNPIEYLKLQEMFYEHQKRLMETSTARVIIVDSAFSQFTYLTCYPELRPDLNYQYNKDTLSYWKNLNEAEVMTFDFAVYCPNVLEIADDGFRPINRKFRKAIDKEYSEFGSSYIKNIHVVFGSPSERVKQVMELFSGLKV